MRVRARCAGPACGHRFTVSGGVRNAEAEAERRRAFFETLIASTPLVGIARARDRAIEASGLSQPREGARNAIHMVRVSVR